MKNASKSESKDRDRYHSDILTNMNNLRQFAQDQIEINKEINYLNSSSKRSSYQNHQYQANKNYDEISNSPPRKKAHNLFFNNRIDPLAQIDTRFPTTQNSQLKNKYSESPKTKSKKFKTKKDQTVSEITSIISPINYKIKNKKKKKLEYNPYLNSKYVQVNPRDIDNFDDIYIYDAKDQIQEQNFNDFKMFQLKSLYFDIWSNKWKRNNIKKIKMDLDYFTKLNNTLKQKETIIPEEEVARELYRLRKRKEKIKQNGFLNYNSSNFSDSNDSFEDANLIKFVQSQSSLESENSIDNELQTPPIYDSQNESDGPPLFFRNRLSYYQLKVGKNKKEEKPDPPLFFEDSSENERFFAAINCNANLIEQENNQIGNNTIDKTEKEEDKQQLGHLNESKLSSNSDQKFDSNKIQKESIPNEKSKEERENQENNQKDESIDIEEEEEANDNFLSPKSNYEINKTIEEEEELNDYFLSPKNSEKEEEEQISDTHSTKSNEKADKQDEKVDSSSTKSCTKTDKSTKEEEEATNSSSINGSEKDNNLTKEEKVKSNSIKSSKNSSQINQEEENTNSNSIKDNKMTKEEEEINSNSIKSSKISSQINQEEEENANSNSIKDTKLTKKDDDKKSDFIKNSKNTNQINKEEEEEENFSSLANSIKSNKSNEESEKKKENSKKSNEESEKSNLLNESDQNDTKGQLKDISSKSASKSDLLIKLPSSGEDFFLNDYENNPHHSSSNSDINTKTHKSQQDDQNEYNLSQMINSEEIADESQPFDEITTSELFENESENPNKKEIKDDQILNNDKKSFVVEEEEDESDAFLSSQKEIVDQLKNNQNIVLIDDEEEGIGTQSYDDDFFSFEKEPKQNKDNQYDYSQSEKKKQSRHKIDSSASEKKNQLQTNSSSHSKNQNNNKNLSSELEKQNSSSNSKNQKNHKNLSSETEKQIQHQTNSSSHSKNHKNLSSGSEKQIQRQTNSSSHSKSQKNLSSETEKQIRYQTNSSSHSRNNKNLSSESEKQIQYQTNSSSHSKSQKNSERRYHHKFNSIEEDEEIESQSKKEIFSFEEEEEELDDDNLNDSEKLFSSGHRIIHDSNKPIFTSPFDEKRFKENEEKEEVEPLSKEQSRIIFGRLVDYYDSDDDKDYELNNDKKESNWYKRFDSSSSTDKSFEIFEIPSRRRNVKNSSSSDDAIVIHIHDPEYDD